MKILRLLTSPLATFLFAFVVTAPAHGAPGDLDPLNTNVVGSTVYSTAVQPDGKIILAGSFTSVLGVPRRNIARLNADGTLDTGFNPQTNSVVYCVTLQPDGKVLLGGEFTTLQPNGAGAATVRQRIARVNADGTLDTGFDPKASDYILSVAVQADGKVLLCGAFVTLQPNGASVATTHYCIARVNTDGTLDTGFDPKPNGTVYSVAVQPDGKVLLGGLFTTLQPNGAGVTTPRQHIARVNGDGTLDTGFDPTTDDRVFSLVVQPDGKVLLAGAFTMLQPNGASSATARQRIARVNADGTLDAAFDPKAEHRIRSLTLQADGKVLLGGDFTTLQPNGAGAATARQYIARVNADGTLDIGFNPQANNIVYSVAVQPNGNVLLGGTFTTLQPNGAGATTTRNYFARVLNDPVTQTLTVPDATQAFWQRGGAGPELSRVSFELSTDGGLNWTSLSSGTRTGTTSNWQRGNLSLPANGSIRARGVTSGGYWNGSSGLIEQVTNFTASPTSFQQWKYALLGPTASDLDDPDSDGLCNILEYATGADPLVRNPLPVVSTITGTSALTFSRNPAATDVTLTVQGSDDLITWTDLARSTGGASMVALVGGVTVSESGAGALRTFEVRDLYAVGDPAHPRRFLRLQATP